MTATGRRAHPRFAIEASVEIRAPAGALEGRTKDISRGGLAAHVGAAVASGSEVEVALSLVFDEATFSEPLALPARVVWCTQLGENDYQLGMAFRSLSAEETEYVGMFLRYLREGDRGAAETRAAERASHSDPFSS